MQSKRVDCLDPTKPSKLLVEHLVRDGKMRIESFEEFEAFARWADLHLDAEDLQGLWEAYRLLEGLLRRVRRSANEAGAVVAPMPED